MKPIGIYMFVDESVDPTKHRAEIETKKFKLVIQGVRSVEEGAAIAKKLVEDGGSPIVELCGSFGYSGAKTVSEALEGKASVGMIVHQIRNVPWLANALKDWL